MRRRSRAKAGTLPAETITGRIELLEKYFSITDTDDHPKPLALITETSHGRNRIILRIPVGPAGTSWYAATNSYQLVPAWYQLVHAGTSRYQLVPAGTS